MKRIKRYLIRLSIALLAFNIGFAIYLFAPPLRSSIKDVPREPPIALVPSKENKGKRCDSVRAYSEEKEKWLVVNPYCAELQDKLLKAVGEGNLEEIKILLSQGANPNEPGEVDSGGLYKIFPHAVYGKNIGVVKLLLDNGADINQVHICCMDRSSLLMKAVYYDQKDMIRLLLSRGADVSIFDFEGNTAFDSAAKNNKEDIAQLFDEAGKVSWLQRAETRIAKLPSVNIKDIHKTFQRWGDPSKK